MPAANVRGSSGKDTLLIAGGDMCTKVRPVVLTLILGVGFGVASCDSGPTQPTPRPGTNVPQTAAVTRVEIAGPTSIEPGGSAQLTANAFKSDGSVENVTSQAQWTSSNAAVLRVESPGVFNALSRGEATINARFGSRSATAQIMVLPAGTFRLTGRISDGSLPLDGVTLTVIEGTGKGLTNVTDGSGAYALYGVAGRVTLHAKKGGFKNSIEEIDVSRNRELDFEMRFDGERGALTGTYTLQLEATPCVSLPENTRKRTYTANVQQHGSRVTVKLDGADFIVSNGRGDHFAGSVGADGKVTFAIGDAYYYFYYGYFLGEFDLVERIDSSALLVVGTVNATSTSAGISGVLNGLVALAQGTTVPFTRVTASCVSSSHRFEMRRR
jgi:hypothetical protein